MYRYEAIYCRSAADPADPVCCPAAVQQGYSGGRPGESGEHQAANADTAGTDTTAKLAEDLDLTRAYDFESLDTVIQAAHILKDFYKGNNTLYKNQDDDSYRLIVRKSSHTPEDFNRIANILSEYGANEKYIPASEAYLEERGALLMKDDALQKLAQL